MTAKEHERRLGELLDAFNSRRFPEYVAGFHDHAVIEYPQSGERIHGRRNILGMFTAFVSPPTLHAWRVDSTGETVLVHAVVQYPGTPEPWFAVIQFQFEGALIVRETAYFAAAFPAAQWRKPFARVAAFAGDAV